MRPKIKKKILSPVFKLGNTQSVSILLPQEKRHQTWVSDDVLRYPPITFCLKLLGPIFHQILCTILNDGYV